MVFGAMKDIGVFEQIDFERLNMRIVADVIDAIPENYEEFKKVLYSAYPSDKENLDSFFAEGDKMFALLDGEEQPELLAELAKYGT